MKYISRYGDKERENTLLLSVSFRFLFVFFFFKVIVCCPAGLQVLYCFLNVHFCFADI